MAAAQLRGSRKGHAVTPTEEEEAGAAPLRMGGDGGDEVRAGYTLGEAVTEET